MHRCILPGLYLSILPIKYPTEKSDRNKNTICPIFSSGVVRVKQIRRTVVLTIAAALGCGLAGGQEPTRLPGQDWISLFNGKDLTGWTKIGQESWTVEDGLIHGKGLTKEYGYLQTEKPFKDFQL